MLVLSVLVISCFDREITLAVTQLRFISSKAVSDMTHIVSMLNKNRSMTDLYKNARLFQKRKALWWFGLKKSIDMLLSNL